MQCKIDGCDRDARYTGIGVCQKHYFRIWRNGTPDIIMSRKYRTQNPAGYQLLFEKTHPLADSRGYVYEHRKIIHDKYGDALPDCELCGKPLTWAMCYIDHKDNDPTNNRPENLRPVCPGCNTGRREKPWVKQYEHQGKTLTVTEWSKQPNVTVGRSQIIHRLRAGYDIADALYMKNKTHPKHNK